MPKKTIFRKAIKPDKPETDGNKLAEVARNFMRLSLKSKYSYNFTWLGLKVIQYPQDLVAIQEIIWKTRPDLIIEAGVAHGGSLVYWASVMHLAGITGRVVGIEIDLHQNNRVGINKHPLSRYIKVIDGSSVSKAVIRKVAAIARKHKKVMVILDSHHTHQHVLAELTAYSGFVSTGCYLVVSDTVLEHLPQGTISDRPWDRGNSPGSAVREFLEGNGEFAADDTIDRKLLISTNPGGYLIRKKRLR